MSNLIDSIVNRNFVEADSIISEAVELIMARKLEEAKKMCAAKIDEQGLDKPSWNLQQRGLVEDEIEEDAIQVPLRGGGQTNVPVQGKVVKQSATGATINKAGTSPVSPAEREGGSRASPQQAVQMTKQADPVGQAQHAQVAKNAASAVHKGYSTRYMPSDPNFQKRAMAAPVGAASRPPGPQEKINEEETEEQLDEARIKIVKARIRGGKIQRRKKVSNVPGMTLRGGKLQRMSPAERRRRKMGARKAKIKRKAKMSRAIMKRQRSLRKRKALGL